MNAFQTLKPKAEPASDLNPIRLKPGYALTSQGYLVPMRTTNTFRLTEPLTAEQKLIKKIDHSLRAAAGDRGRHRYTAK